VRAFISQSQKLAGSSLYAADWPQKRDFAKFALQIGKNVWFLARSDENSAFLTVLICVNCKTCASDHGIVQLDQLRLKRENHRIRA
jgi:hypothetical protein